MLSARLNELFASTSFRLALVCAAVVVIAFTLAGLGTWYVTKSAAENASRERIQLEMNSLQDEIREEGLGAGVAAIGTRQRLPGALEYRLVDAGNRLLSGDLDVEPLPLGWSTLYLPNAGMAPGPDLIVLKQQTPGGGSLAVAEDLEHTEGVRYDVLRTLFWIGGAALLLSVIVGYLVARGALRRMDGVFLTMQRVGAGDLGARVPLRESGANSDVGALSSGINDMLGRVETLVRNLRRVSTDIAHDLRTPLTHVRQQLEHVEAAASLDTAKTAARQAQHKVDDLMRSFEAMLRLAEIEAGAARARFARVDLAELVERIADAYRPDVEGAGGALTVEARGPQAIDGDADLLSQALANLLDNAMAHTPAGPAITMRLVANSAVVRLEVEDDGPGVPEAERARVLDPFVRVDHSRSGPGVGLGLSIVNAIARLHGARVVLEDAKPGLRVALEWRRS